MRGQCSGRGGCAPRGRQCVGHQAPPSICIRQHACVSTKVWAAAVRHPGQVWQTGAAAQATAGATAQPSRSPCALKPLGAVTQPSISFQGPSGIKMGAAGMVKSPGGTPEARTHTAGCAADCCCCCCRLAPERRAASRAPATMHTSHVPEISPHAACSAASRSEEHPPPPNGAEAAARPHLPAPPGQLWASCDLPYYTLMSRVLQKPCSPPPLSLSLSARVWLQLAPALSARSHPLPMQQTNRSKAMLHWMVWGRKVDPPRCAQVKTTPPSTSPHDCARGALLLFVQSPLDDIGNGLWGERLQAACERVQRQGEEVIRSKGAGEALWRRRPREGPS